MSSLRRCRIRNIWRGLTSFKDDIFELYHVPYLTAMERYSFLQNKSFGVSTFLSDGFR